MNPIFKVLGLVLVIALYRIDSPMGSPYEQALSEKVDSLLLIAEEYDNPATSLIYLKEAYQYIYDLEDSLETSLYYNLGVAHGKLYHIDSSKYFFDLALNVATNISNELLAIGALNGLGNIARIESDNDQAMQYFQLALQKAQTVDDREYVIWRSKLLANIAGIYFDLGQFNSALNYTKEALTFAKKAEHNFGIAQAYNQLGYLYSELDSARQGLEYSTKAANYLQKANDSLGLVYQHYSLGMGYFQINNLDKAKENFLLAKQLAEKFSEAETYAGSLNQLGLIELELGSPMEAYSYASNALQYCIQHKLTSHLKGTYDLLYKIELIKKDYKKALSFRNEYYLLNDSIVNQESVADINALNAKYESEKKEREITQLNYQNELANAEINNVNNVRNGVILVSIIMITFLIYVYFNSKKQFKLKKDLLGEEISGLRLKITSLIPDANELDITIEKLNLNLVTLLTQREYDVLELTFSDKSNSQIADQLFVSVNTVKTHLKNVFDKMGVSNRKEAFDKALSKIN